MNDKVLIGTNNLVEHQCWCGVWHAIPAGLSREAMERGHAVHCPLGHSWSIMESETEKLRKKLVARQADLDQARAAVLHERDRREREVADERRHTAAARGQLTKIKNRVAHGVCPCCKRTFQQLARHMRTKHPEYAAPPGATP